MLHEAGDRLGGGEGDYWEGTAGHFTSAGDHFEGLAALVSLASQAPSDLSAARFFREAARAPALKELAEWALRIVEGFDAADPERASIKAIAEEWSGDAGLQAPQGRPERGYGALVRNLVARLPKTVELRLTWPVHAVEWSRGRVTVAGPGGERLEARAAVVTLPLSLLKASEGSARVAFSPSLNSKRSALDLLHMGSVLKVVLRYTTPFWVEVDGGALARAAFFFRSNPGPFPTFWTTWPARTPQLTAWYGGPGAEALSSRSDEEIIATARKSLSAIFAEQTMTNAVLAEAWVHNWQRDPWAEGAYSYVGIGGQSARARLAEALDGTLFFAGEATDSEGQASTVAGALGSGIRVASEVKRALSTPDQAYSRP